MSQVHRYNESVRHLSGQDYTEGDAAMTPLSQHIVPAKFFTGKDQVYETEPN